MGVSFSGKGNLNSVARRKAARLREVNGAAGQPAKKLPTREPPEVEARGAGARAGAGVGVGALNHVAGKAGGQRIGCDDRRRKAWQSRHMRLFRSLLADRFQNGMAILLLGYLLVLQGLLGAMAQGVMAASPGADVIICSTSGATGLPGNAEAGGTAPSERRAPHDCPCATACRMAGAMAAVTLDTGLSHRHPLRMATATSYASRPAAAIGRRPHQTPDARAPPLPEPA